MSTIRVTMTCDGTMRTIFTPSEGAFGNSDVAAVKAVLPHDGRSVAHLLRRGEELWVTYPAKHGNQPSLDAVRVLTRRHSDAKLITYHSPTKRALGDLVTQIS